MPGPEGRTLGFPVQGVTTDDGRYIPDDGQFTFTCTSGAMAKCIRFGYPPWGTAADGRPLLDHFRACTRMVRGDYCGNGSAHTRDGTLINMYDRVGIQVSEPTPDLTFEAAWGPDGAVCVNHTRWDEDFGMDDLRTACGCKAGGTHGRCLHLRIGGVHAGGGSLQRLAGPPLSQSGPAATCPRRSGRQPARASASIRASASMPSQVTSILATIGGGQHQETHDRIAADRLAVAGDTGAGVEPLDSLDELGRRSGVQALGVADGERAGDQGISPSSAGSRIEPAEFMYLRPASMAARTASASGFSRILASLTSRGRLAP